MGTTRNSAISQSMFADIPLENDSILPEQFFTKRLLLEPEMRLIAAVLEDALQVYSKHRTDGDQLVGRFYTLWMNACNWLVDVKETRIFSLVWCCEALGIDAVAVAKKIAAREPIASFRHTRLVVQHKQITPTLPYRRHKKKAGAAR